jgi:hypothetical protein
MEYLLLCLCLILLLYVAISREATDMGTPADLAKLVANMKRANSIVDRASIDAAKHTMIMDSFEQRLNLNHENMSKIEEYDKMMAAMEQGNNGGPALEVTFPSSTTVVAVTAPLTPASSTPTVFGKPTVGMFNH